MSTIYDKPFRRYDQLIALLRSRNLIINDEDFAKNALSNMSYYTLVNGYKNTVLSVPGTDTFLPGTRFEELYVLHTIDVSIGNELLKYLLYIERSLKSKISYVVSRKYGVFSDPGNYAHNDPNDYLYRGYYSNSNGARNNTLRKLTETLDGTSNPGKFQSKSLTHYIHRHNHVPPWILTTSITFGQAIRWYSILKPDDRLEVCNGFLDGTPLTDDAKKEYVKKSLDLLREFRNNIAHGSRTILNYGKVVIPKAQIITLSQGIITGSDYNANPFAQKGLYAVLAVIITMLNDKFLMSQFAHELEFILSPYKKVYIGGKTINELFYLPADILERINRFQI